MEANLDLKLSGEALTGLDEIEMGGRIQVDDKKIINCRADLNQLFLLNMTGHGKNILMLVQIIDASRSK